MIYLVTVGEYDDYRVLKASHSKSFAEEYVKEHNKDPENKYYQAEAEEVEEI